MDEYEQQLNCEIVYDEETRDYAMLVDGELVGYKRTFLEAERYLQDLRYEKLRRYPHNRAA